MSKLTIREYIGQLHGQLIDRGCDIAPSNVGYILSEFVQTMFTGDEFGPATNQAMQEIANACAAIQDE